MARVVHPWCGTSPFLLKVAGKHGLIKEQFYAGELLQVANHGRGPSIFQLKKHKMRKCLTGRSTIGS